MCNEYEGRAWEGFISPLSLKPGGVLCSSDLRVFLKTEQKKEARRNSEVESYILDTF